MVLVRCQSRSARGRNGRQAQGTVGWSEHRPCQRRQGDRHNIRERRGKRYGAFDILLPKTAEILGSHSTPKQLSAQGDIATYDINRTVNGVNRVVFVYFLRGEDGVRRLDSM